jgi:hypothetical protein
MDEDVYVVRPRADLWARPSAEPALFSRPEFPNLSVKRRGEELFARPAQPLDLAVLVNP